MIVKLSIQKHSSEKYFPSLYIRPPKHTNDWLIHKYSSSNTLRVLHRKYINYDFKSHPEDPWFETVRIWDNYSSNQYLPIRGTRSNHVELYIGHILHLSLLNLYLDLIWKYIFLFIKMSYFSQYCLAGCMLNWNVISDSLQI